MRAWVIVSALLVGMGLGGFLYKVARLHYPLSTAGAPQTWRVEHVVNVTGQGSRAVIDVPLPRTSSYQRLLTEEVRSGPLRFSIIEEAGGRRGRWSGKLEGTARLSYEVTFVSAAHQREIPPAETRPLHPKAVQPFLAASPGVQVKDPAVAELARELSLPAGDKVQLAWAVFDFVSREIGTLRGSGDMDAVSVIREGRGNGLGRARLFCALARAHGLPCRIVTGLVLTKARRESLRYWNEAYLGNGWVPFDVVDRRAGTIPANRLALTAHEARALTSSGTSAASYRFFVQSESATYAELVRRRLADSQHPVDRWSLLLLPVQAQHSLRVLVLVPLGVLVMCVLRNIVGIRTFGLFMPMLLALALTETGLLWGTAFLAVIVGVALLSRLWIQGFYLLLTARIAFVLTMIVLLMVLLLLAGDRLQIPTTGVGAFPFVILTMIVERISVSLEEEGTRNTIRRAGATLVAVYATYAVVHAAILQTVFLVFPELLLVILGLLILVGRYTGYRLVELIRFRELLAASAQAHSQVNRDAA
jgi:transglutaminase-like putative cysteine protease